MTTNHEPIEGEIPHPHLWNDDRSLGIRGLRTTDKPPNVYMDPETGEFLRSTYTVVTSTTQGPTIVETREEIDPVVLRRMVLSLMEERDEAVAYCDGDPSEKFPLLAKRAAQSGVTLAQAREAFLDELAALKQ